MRDLSMVWMYWCAGNCPSEFLRKEKIDQFAANFFVTLCTEIIQLSDDLRLDGQFPRALRLFVY